jgi:hypothetical protein
MLELALLFVVISAVVRPFGAAYADVANTTLEIAAFIALAWLVTGFIALFVHRPLERRVLHHA